MKRMWLKFSSEGHPHFVPGAGIGVGVTGVDREDCLTLVRERLFEGHELPPIEEEVEDVDTSDLPMTVLTLMRPPSVLGVWFPLAASH